MVMLKIAFYGHFGTIYGLLLRVFFDGDPLDPGDMGFGGFNIFPKNYFTGDTKTIVLKIVKLLLDLFLTIGVLFAGWKIASAGIDYFNADTHHLGASGRKYDTMLEIFEPIKGLALLLIIGILLNFFMGGLISQFDTVSNFEVSDPQALTQAPDFGH